MNDDELKKAEALCEEALVNARAFVKYKAPYVAKTLYGLVAYSEPGLGTLGVSSDLVMLVDPTWFTQHKVEVQGGLLMHEISHILRDLGRLDRFPDAKLANIAFDIPINFDLRSSGWELPSDGYFPETFGFPEGLTGEQYYELLEKNREKVQKKLQELGASGVGKGQCGSCAGNAVNKLLEQELGRTIGRTIEDVNHIRKTTVADIQKAAQGRGNVPSTLSEILPPEDAQELVKISWRIKLSRILRHCTGRMTAGRADYSYSRLARSSFVTGLIKPGMVSRKPVVAFVEDTSGSMGTEQTLEVRQQAVDVMLQLGIESAWWISADAAVAEPPKMRKLREIRNLPVIGRGGTDFSPAITLAQKLNPRPDILIYGTDGDGKAPALPPPRMEVVFCIVRSYYNKSPADWGHTVIIADEVA